MSDRQRLLLRARITLPLVRSRSATRTRPLYSRGDRVILFQSLGLGGARTGDCALRLGRLLSDGRLVVLPATGQSQEATAQQCEAQSAGEQPHDEYDSPPCSIDRLVHWCIPSGHQDEHRCSKVKLGRMGDYPPYGPIPEAGLPPPGLRAPPSRNDHPGPLFMLREPRQGGKAERIIGFCWS